MKHVLFLFVCMEVYACEWQCPLKSRTSDLPGAGLPVNCEQLDVGGGTELRSLAIIVSFLTVEPCLQSLDHIFVLISKLE